MPAVVPSASRKLPTLTRPILGLFRSIGWVTWLPLGADLVDCSYYCKGTPLLVGLGMSFAQMQVGTPGLAGHEAGLVAVIWNEEKKSEVGLR
jgi:hypothetical protein